MSLRKTTCLTSLSISNWTARKYDKKVSLDVEDRYNAKDAGRYNKLLIPKEEMKAYMQIAQQARNYQYFHTLPWEDGGQRIMLKTFYHEYIRKMVEYKEAYYDAIDKFLVRYPLIKEEAMSRLGKMYAPSDYPPLEELRDKFSYHVNVYPIPNSADQDMRYGLSEMEAKEIEQNIEERIQRSMDEAMDDLVMRIYKVINHMVDKLKDADAKFKNSLVGNIRELCNIFPHLNIMGDEKLNELIQEVDQKLAIYDPDELRNNTNIRNKVANDASKILEKVLEYHPIRG